MSSTELDTSHTKWNRIDHNNRSQLSSLLLDIRWRLIQYFPLSKFTYYNRYLNAVTPFEIIAAISIYIIIVVVGSVANGTGDTSQYTIFIGVIIACRYNLLQLLMGVSWERALLFHKVFSMSSLSAGIVHGAFSLVPYNPMEVYQSPILFSGVSLLVLMSLQPILYVFFKSYWFEGFYYSHMLVYIAMTYAAVVHNAVFILYASVVWAVDMIVRNILTSRKVIIRIKNVTSDITMVSIDSKMNYRAGQYVFLMIPSLGVLQWHPFSISSSPHDDKVTSDVYT